MPAGEVRAIEQPYEYLLFRQIQAEKARWYAQHGEGLSVQAAVVLLRTRGETAFGVPPKPDFLSWDLVDMRALRELTGRIPVPVHEVRAVRSGFQGEENGLSVHNAVQITLVSCYAREELIPAETFGVVYVLEGSGLLATRHGSRRMYPGELCILPPNIPYSVRTGPDDLVIQVVSRREHFEQNFHLLLSRDNLVSDFFRRALFQHAGDCMFFMVPPSRDFCSILQHLFAEFVQRDEYSESLFYNYLQIFYANILRSVQSTYEYYAPQREMPSQMVVPAILHYISQHYRTLTMERLAGHFHYDSAYLGKRLKAATGSSYTQIVTGLRLAEAERLLAQTGQSIAAIARQVGYRSTDLFTYAFKKRTGLAPRAYRAKNQT